MNGTLTDNDVVISNPFCDFFTNIGRQYSADIGPATFEFDAFLKGNYPNSLFMRLTTPTDIQLIIR